MSAASSCSLLVKVCCLAGAAGRINTVLVFFARHLAPLQYQSPHHPRTSESLDCSHNLKAKLNLKVLELFYVTREGMIRMKF